MSAPAPSPSLAGNVPTLVLEDGTILNEGAATLQYIADQNPACKLAPAAGTVERYKLIQHLNYIASEVHVAIGGLFNPTLSAEAREATKVRAYQKMDYMVKHVVPETGFLLGADLSVADLYLAIVLSWTGYVGLDKYPAEYPTLKAYTDRVWAHDGVKKAQAEMAANPKA